MAKRVKIPTWFFIILGLLVVYGLFSFGGLVGSFGPVGLGKGIRCPSGDYGQRDSGCPAGKVWCKDVGCIEGLTPEGCPADQYYCPGVGCVSGKDKCTPMSVGGPSAVFSREGFDMPSAQQKATPCPDGSRTTNGKCLGD